MPPRTLGVANAIIASEIRLSSCLEIFRESNRDIQQPTGLYGRTADVCDQSRLQVRLGAHNTWRAESWNNAAPSIALEAFIVR